MRESYVNKRNYCQYCFADYIACDCCERCSAVKGSCACNEDSPTILSPADMYKVLYEQPDLMEGCWGITELEQVDLLVMRTYKRECWPERLKQKEFGVKRD
jgi:hypothetical protein